MKIFIFLLALVAMNSHAVDCSLNRRYPPQGSWTLSNGSQLPIPMNSCDFDSVAITALLDLAKVRAYLAPYGLYPAVVKGQALGMLSAFNFKDSGIGPFTEMYFSVAAMRKPSENTATSVLELLRALRRPGSGGNKDFVFFYVSVFSGTPAARMMSEEVWRIPSTLSNVEMGDDKGPTFSLAVNGQLWAKADLRSGPWAINPLGLNYTIAISGPSPDGKPVYSPIAGQGSTRLTAFRPKAHHLEVGENALGKALRFYQFSPVLIEWAHAGQAAQFAPESE